MPAPLMVHAHAKINLGLEILGRRDDGLHEVATVLQSISLADRLSFTPSEQLTLRCHGMAATADNLILQAARLLQGHAGIRQGCTIVCVKHIPVAAGLGGGSADAGATLRALNQLWDCALADEELNALAGRLGADVPFAIRGGTALATGSGRDLTMLPDAPPLWLALAPLGSPTGDKTREMYVALTREDYTDGSAIQRQVAAIRGGRVERHEMPNAFQRHAVERWPQTQRAVGILRASGAAVVSLAGAGPSAFGLHQSQAGATAACSALRIAGLPAIRARLVGRQD